MSLSYFLLVERNQLSSFIQAIFEIDCMSAAEVVKANYDASKLTDTYFKKINYISSLIISTFQAMVSVKNIEFPIGCGFICERLLTSNDDRCIDVILCIIFTYNSRLNSLFRTKCSKYKKYDTTCYL